MGSHWLAKNLAHVINVRNLGRVTLDTLRTNEIEELHVRANEV